jgi:hypothetical protein
MVGAGDGRGHSLHGSQEAETETKKKEEKEEGGGRRKKRRKEKRREKEELGSQNPLQELTPNNLSSALRCPGSKLQ